MIAKLPQYWFNKTGLSQRRVTTVTDGSVAVTYSDNISELAMRLVSVKGGENGNQERLNTQNPFQIYLSGGPDVVATDRIIFSDRVFDILSVNNPDENSTYTRCDCVEVSPSAAPPEWPFDTDFDFPVGNLTGNDGWTTAGTDASVLVTSSGIGPVSAIATARNNRVLPDGAPSSNGPWWLAFDIDGIGGVNHDQTIDTAVYASGTLSAQILLNYIQSANRLDYAISVPAGNIGGTVSGFAPGPDRYVLTLDAAANMTFYNNAGPIFSLTSFSAGLVTFDSIAVGIIDNSSAQSARISRLYFGAEVIT